MYSAHRIIFHVVMLCCILIVAFVDSPFAAQKGKFHVIGVGPAGPQTATLQAIQTIKEMDAIIASEEHLELFKSYLGDKSSLFAPWSGIWDYKGKPYRKLNAAEKEKLKNSRIQKRDQRVARIRELLEQGKDVGLLDSGNPCLFGPSHWYIEQFEPDEVTIIPGMGADAAAMAALGKSTIPAHDTRFVMQTAPSFLTGREGEDWDIMQDLADYPSTKILYMALRDPENLFANLSRHLPQDMPCAVVFWAGYPDKQQVVRGNISNMPEKLSDYEEDFMGLLLIGRFLEGKPYESAQQR